MLFVAARPRHSLERQLLKSCGRLRNVKIALRIDRDLMAGSDDTGRLDIADDGERLSIDNKNALIPAHVEVLLIRIWRQGQVASERDIRLDNLLEELAFFREHLNAAVLPIGDVYGSVLRNPDRMHDAELLRTGIGKTLWGHNLAIVVIDGFVAEGAPHPLERAAVRIEDSDPVITVAICH